MTDENLDKVERLEKIATELGTNMSVLALAWILRKPVMTQIEEILGFNKFERHVG